MPDHLETRASSPSLQQAYRSWLQATRSLLRTILQSLSSDVLLFIAAMVVYIASRLIALERFPIYFFSDEAVLTVRAADLIRDNLYGYDGVFLPTYFENSGIYYLGLSVYLQVIPYLLFGKSVFVTRAVPALITASAALALGLILKRTYRNRYWWAAPLVFALTPTWFLHSRTAFDTTLFVSFTTWCFYFYLEYRHARPANLLPAVFFGGLAFYSYSGARVILAGLAIFLFIVDMHYHRKHLRFVWLSIGLAMLFTLPYIRFLTVHAGETAFHLRRFDSYWLHDISFASKLARLLWEYLQSLNPYYWFARFPEDVPRHLMLGYGRISILASPFFFIGIFQTLREWRQPSNYLLLILALVTPIGAAMVSVGITRLLLFVIPASIFTCMGLATSLSMVNRRLSYPATALTIFLLFSTLQGLMLRDAVINGPTWFDDYTMSGMQYGADEVFFAAADMAENPDYESILVSPTWANGTHILQRFFLPDGGQVSIANANGFLENYLPERLRTTMFVLTPAEYSRLLADPKATDVVTHKIINYPNDQAGFYFVTFDYSAQAQELFAEDQRLREIPNEKRISYLDQSIEVVFPHTDMGRIEDVFDGDTYTMLRFYDANPATISISFEEPVEVKGIELTTGSMDFSVQIQIQSMQDTKSLGLIQVFEDMPDDPTVKVEFSQTISEVSFLEIQVQALHVGHPFQIHVREIVIY